MLGASDVTARVRASDVDIAAAVAAGVTAAVEAAWSTVVGTNDVPSGVETSKVAKGVTAAAEVA